MKPPPYTVEPPPGYEVPSFPYKPPVVYQQPPHSQGAYPEGEDSDPRRRHYVHVHRPNSHMPLALCACFLCNFILGGIAIWYSYRSQNTDDYVIANNQARISLILSLIAIFAGILIYFIVIMVAVV